MQGHGSNTQNTLGLSGKNGRAGEPDYGTGTNLAAAEMAARKHFVPPANDLSDVNQVKDRRESIPAAGLQGRDAMPPYYNNYDGLPVPYTGPSELKEQFLLRQSVREAAGRAVQEAANAGQAPGVVRTDPISDGEVAYLKHMKDQSELARFDDYVESFIDPRQPGNMKWLMEIYPDYVNRRLQQAHTDYEFALRNQMIDSWGINTFDDLHFKYMVDQGKISGPRLKNERPATDMSYTPGVLSPYNFQSPRKGAQYLRLPFASAQHGRRPQNPDNWTLNRENRPLGMGNTEPELATAMYGNQADNNVRNYVGGQAGARVDPFYGGGPRGGIGGPSVGNRASTLY